jgi:hypothetical protein
LQTLTPFRLSPIPLVAATKFSLWERVFFWWKQGQTNVPWRPLGVATALFLCVALGWRLWRAEVTPREDAQRNPTTSTLAVASSPVDALPQPQIIAALRDGARTVTLDEQGHLQGLPALSPAAEQLVKTALRDRRLLTPAAYPSCRITPTGFRAIV